MSPMFYRPPVRFHSREPKTLQNFTIRFYTRGEILHSTASLSIFLTTEISANCTLKNVSFLLGAKAIDKDDLADLIHAHAAHIYHCAIGYWSIRISLLDHDLELQRKPRESFPSCAASFRIQFLISGALRQRDAD